MNGTLRSKQGCWTCRLRRKKCDERQPVCSTCELLKITCYGYGTKPDWMDGGPKEKAMIEQIKQIVKHTSRRKGRLNVALNRFQRKEEVPKLAPKPTTAITAPAPLPTSESTPSSDNSALNATGSSPEQSNETNDTSPVCFSRYNRGHNLPMLTLTRIQRTIMQTGEVRPGCLLRFQAKRLSCSCTSLTMSSHYNILSTSQVLPKAVEAG